MSASREFMYEKIYHDLLLQITNGRYPPGSRIPSEKELAQTYAVSRITSKKALGLLAEEGWISRMPGRGSFVLSKSENADRECAAGTEPLALPSGNRPKMLGVILDSFGSDFGSYLLKSIEQECRKRKYNMILHCTNGSVEEENRAIQCAVELGAAGLILMCAQDETYNKTIIQLSLDNFPMVLVDRQMQGISIPCIKTDNYQAAKDLTRVLIEKGHKRLCFVSHSSMRTPTIRERYEGFMSSIMEYDDINGKIVEVAGYNPAAQDEAEEYRNYDFGEMEELLRKNEDCGAFFCVEYKLGVLLHRTMRALGQKKEIVSFDGLDSIYSEYAFVHVKQDERLMGVRAVEVIDEIIRGKAVKGNLYIPYRLVDGDNDI